MYLFNLLIGERKAASPVEIFFGDGAGVLKFLRDQGVPHHAGRVEIQTESYTRDTGRLRIHDTSKGSEEGWYVRHSPEEGLTFTHEGPYRADPNEWI